MKSRIIESEIFRLRPIKNSDIDSIVKYTNDRSVTRHTFIPYPNTIESVTAFLSSSRIAERKGTGLNFGIEYKESGEIIGSVGFTVINKNFRRGEFGYWLAKKYRNQGIMTEATELVVRHAFTKLKLKRIHAFVDPDNVASIKVLEKCGFENEGLLKKFIKQNNRYKDMYIFAIIND